MIIYPTLHHHVRQDGKAKIMIYVYDPATRAKSYVPTDIYVNPDHWKGRELDRREPQSKYINPKLKKIVLDLENHCLVNPGSRPGDLSFRADKTATPLEYFKWYISQCEEGKIVKKSTKEPMTRGYLKALGTSLHHFEKYKPTQWNDFSESWFDSYVRYLREKNYKQNYIAKSVKHLKMVVDYARSKNVHTNQDTKYTVLKEKTQKIKLTPQEVERISDLDLNDWPDLQAEQERFTTAYNLLVRFGDSISIKETNIILRDKRHFLSAFTQKGKKEILLPIKPSVYKILKKHNFSLRSSNSSSNEKLKQIGMMAKINDPVTITEFRNGQKIETRYKKYQLLETHTTRRSAARNLFDSGMPPEIIMVLGGWSTMKQLLDYIDIDLDYAAKKAAEHPFFN